MPGTSFSNPVAGGTANGYVIADGFTGPDAPGVAPGLGSSAPFPNGMKLGNGQFLIESASFGIVAHAGGGKANATPLTSELNQVATVATVGDSVLLPASQAGLTIIVTNLGANAMQVFGAGTDTIDGVATAVGVSQMAGSQTIYACSVAGQWSSNGIGQGYAGSFPTQSYANTLTAKAAGGQQAASPVTAVINQYTTVATIGDSATLPPSASGETIYVFNAAANSMNVFPNTGEQINALGANAAFALAGGKNAAFICPKVGQWHAILSS